MLHLNTDIARPKHLGCSMDAAEVPQVSPTLGGCHPLKTWVISPLESPKKLPKMGYTGDRGDFYQFPFGRNNDEFGHSHILPTQQMIYLFLPAFKASFLSGHLKYCGLSTSSWCVLGVSTPYERCCTLRFRLLLNHFQMPGLGFHTQ